MIVRFNMGLGTFSALCLADMRRYAHLIWCLLALALISPLLAGGCAREVKGFSSNKSSLDGSSLTHIEDVIYGRKDGMALTLDVFAPREANGAAVILVVSGGWYSSHDLIGTQIPQLIIGGLTQRGYTVFAVVHGSQPKYNIPQILPDMQRAVRYIRYHAADYHIDPQYIGITGASSGGHLALMQGMASSTGDPEASDPIEQVSSRVQAVVSFFAPTDFLNYGKPGASGLDNGPLKNFPAAFAFQKGNPEKRTKIERRISPINGVTPDDPPTLFFHGDKDLIVPLQQSETMVTRLKKFDIPARLIVKPGAGHGWGDFGKDVPVIADWFDMYLLRK